MARVYKNYRGSENEEYRSSERSKVFVKVTKVKVLVAYGQIIDILFANKRFLYLSLHQNQKV